MDNNQVTIVESSDISNDEMSQILADFETQGLTGTFDGTHTPEPAEEVPDMDAAAINFHETHRELMELVDEVAPEEPTPAPQAEETPAPQLQPVIPPNSPSLLVEETSSRFSSAIWYDAVRAKSVLLAGVGGIGSYVAFLLSRMKPASITMYDPDIVEPANMSGQLYKKQDVGQAKVDSIANMMGDYSGYYNTMSIRERFERDSQAQDIMICGFDNMAARSLFFIKWKEHLSMLQPEERKKCLFIDGRLAAEEFQVLCITGDDLYHQQKYMDEYLFSDAEADATVCSYKQTSHCANMIASVMVNLFVNFVANECDPLIPRDLPFLTTYDAERMYFKTEII